MALNEYEQDADTEIAAKQMKPGTLSEQEDGPLPVSTVLDDDPTAYCRWADDGGQNLD